MLFSIDKLMKFTSAFPGNLWFYYDKLYIIWYGNHVFMKKDNSQQFFCSVEFY